MRASVGGGGAETSASSAVPIHHLEIALVALVITVLVILPWSFGGVDLWAQMVVLGFAALAWVLSLLPRKVSAGSGSTAGRTVSMILRLKTFPIFWAGLYVMAYIGIQAMNPRFEYHQEGTQWWLEQISYLRWLPGGMRVPFDNSSPLRWLVEVASCWLISCALWVGATRRRTIYAVLVALSINAVVFACFGILQKASGVDKIYGLRSVGFPYFFGALIYKNHAAAFLGLSVCLLIGVGARIISRKRKSHDKSGPGLFLAILVALMLLALVATLSFSGILLYGAAAVVSTVLVLYRYFRRYPKANGRWLVLISGAVLLVSTAVAIAAADWSGITKKTSAYSESEMAYAASLRLLAAQQGVAMLADHWTTGWGAGCFQYGFSKYQKRVPALTEWRQLHMRWEHVHNDWLEWLIELGVLGSAPIFFVMGMWIRNVWRQRAWRVLAIMPVLCGLLALAVQALMDFPFHNLAIAATVAALLPIVVRLAEIENRELRL